MSLFAGVWSVEKKLTLDGELLKKIEKNLSRTEGTYDTFLSPHFFFVKFDFGAFGEDGYYESEDFVSGIAGEPYVASEKVCSGRMQDLLNLSVEVFKGNIDVLKSCNGTFSFCHYNKKNHLLYIATDKLGVRPIYYYFDKDYLYFSSSMRVLEIIDEIPKIPTIESIVEKRIFGVSLGSKTKYSDIKVLRDGQFIKCDKHSPKISYYHRWDKIKSSGKTLNGVMEECYEVFMAAVACRSSRDDTFFSFLSGGLDSRSVVTLLHDLGKRVFTYNFSRPGEQDELFAAQYASRLGVEYSATYRPKKKWTWWGLIAEAIAEESKHEVNIPKYPKLVFSGDGGSVGVGHVYIDHVLIDLLSQNKIDEAVHYFLQKRHFPKKILKSKVLREIEYLPFAGMKREIDDLAEVEPGREAYLFLLRNDQRKHLHDFYEEIDLARIELLLPFYDARLLELIVAAPIKPFLYHDFYHKWLELFPDVFRSVPWQTYPGHVKCPVNHDTDYVSQWQSKKGEDAYNNNTLSMKRCLKMILKNDFPKDIVSRLMLFSAIILHAMRVKNYSYVFDFALDVYSIYANRESLN